ncbi:MAG: hypothetical protein B6I28_00120 [Fusobacteriia bacterium 4572_132]|nr:MAG: hypothetical protein B6I28_00120 [Fusobacteriia bacterium 4572_132]
MRNKLKFLFLIILIISGCFNNTTPSNKITKIILKSSKSKISANGKDFSLFTVEGKKANGKIVNLTDVAKYYDNNFIMSPSFNTLISGNHSIIAEYNNLKTNIIILKAEQKEDFFYKGADISFLPELKDKNVVFKNALGKEEELLMILKNNGINTIRLRLWVDNEYCNLEKTLYMAKEIRKAGLNFLLDFHYSDTWADPRSQIKPNSWKDLDLAELKIKMYDYTLDIINQLKEQGTPPQLVQIGNEINNGILNPEGNISKNGFEDFSNLLKSGIKAINDSFDKSDIKIIIHIAGYNSANWFFDNLVNNNIDFDIIGLSYYPWWHGKSLDDLTNNLKKISEKYGKEIIIMETAYPWTFEWNDWTNNIVGSEDKLIDSYPGTVLGQKQFLVDLLNKVKTVPNNKGKGVFYWAPEWVAFKGDNSKDGSSWENLTLFDFENVVLNSIEAFNE